MKNKFIIYLDAIIAVCLYLFIFFLPFSNAGAEVFTWYAISLWLLKRIFGYKSSGPLSPLMDEGLNKAILIFVIVNALTVVVSLNPQLSIRAFFGKILKFVMLSYIVVETINNKKRLRNILFVMAMSAILIVSDSAVQYFTGKDFLRGYPYEPLRASFPSANGFAGWLVIFIPVFSSILIAKQFECLSERAKNTFMTALVILLLVCLILTNSSGGWLGFILGSGFFAYRIIKSLHRKSGVLGYLLLVVFLLGISTIFPQLIKDILKSSGDITTNSNRIGLWRESLAIIKDFPVLGSGLNTYSVVAPHYKILEGGGIYPHNSYLQMAAETGLIGLLSFIWVLAELFKLGLRALNNKKDLFILGLLAGILSFLAQSFFDTNLYSLRLVVLFWFMIGLTVATAKLETQAQ